MAPIFTSVYQEAELTTPSKINIQKQSISRLKILFTNLIFPLCNINNMLPISFWSTELFTYTSCILASYYQNGGFV